MHYILYTLPEILVKTTWNAFWQQFMVLEVLNDFIWFSALPYLYKHKSTAFRTIIIMIMLFCPTYMSRKMPPQFDNDDLSDGSRPLLNPTNPHTRPIHISPIVTSVIEQTTIPNAYLPIKEKCLHNRSINQYCFDPWSYINNNNYVHIG